MPYLLTGLVLLSIGLAIWSAGGKVQPWPAIFVLGLTELIQIWGR